LRMRAAFLSQCGMRSRRGLKMEKTPTNGTLAYFEILRNRMIQGEEVDIDEFIEKVGPEFGDQSFDAFYDYIVVNSEAEFVDHNEERDLQILLEIVSTVNSTNVMLRTLSKLPQAITRVLRLFGSGKRKKTATSGPPLAADWLLYLCLPKSARECVPGDLEEEFRKIIVPKVGANFARMWYWKQAIFSIMPFLAMQIDSAVDWILRKVKFVIGLG